MIFFLFLCFLLFVCVLLKLAVDHLDLRAETASPRNSCSTQTETSVNQGMAGPAAAAASSSSSSFASIRYDVFISFRGEDTRSNFRSHLHNALLRRGIQPFVDDDLPRGEKILPELYKAIQESYISVIIFSQGYASSRWCLHELVHILDCKKKMGKDVIPVFYKIDPSHVRNPLIRGSYMEAFKKHKLRFNQETLNTWKDALVEAANLSGWDSHTYRYETELIDMIVEGVLRKLAAKCPPRKLERLFGVNENLAPIESLLKEFQTIGIWGMGGIGKTTIARRLWYTYSSGYGGSCFLANIREKSGVCDQNLYDLNNKLVSELLEDNDLDKRNTTTMFALAERRLSTEKVFIVLDDVSTSTQLEWLLGTDKFGSGSRIIITTRDRHVLNERVDAIYKVKELNPQESIQLFSLNAFKQDHPKMGYEDFSKRAVGYAKGIPLALRVLGSFLHSKSKEEWKSALEQLKQTLHGEIKNVLRLSFGGLNNQAMESFLDIACFLKGEHKDHVIRLLDSYEFYAHTSLRTLQDNALISTENNYIQMHDMIQQMGWEIAHEQSIKNPGKRSRLWDPKDVCDVLKKNKGTEMVEGIMLDMSQIGDLQLSDVTFRKMIDLRFLKFYLPWGVRNSTVYLPAAGLQLFSDKLRYLEWNRYPAKSLPLTFSPYNLVELIMPDSHVEKLWDGVQDLVNVKRINLQGSKCLLELPDFSKASNLVEADLSFCESLCHVHPSILSLHSLVTLSLTGCKNLKTLESEIHLRSLRTLKINGCSSLKKFSLSSKEISYLNLTGTKVQMLHSSIGLLSKLEFLKLESLRLKNLPNELSCLKNLWELDLSHSIEQVLPTRLPDNIGILSSLCSLNLTGSKIEYLPASIKQFAGLKCIRLCNCRRLRSLPQLPPSVIDLDATNCTSLKTAIIPRTSRPLERLRKSITFKNCMELEDSAVSSIMENIHFSIKQIAYEIVSGGKYDERWINHAGYCYKSQMCFPGSTVPEWFEDNWNTGASITIELAPSSQLSGLVLCVVLPPLCPSRVDPRTIQCNCYFEDFSGCKTEWVDGFRVGLSSDHVYLLYDPVLCRHILERVRERARKDYWNTNSKGTTYDPMKTTFKSKVEFHFHVTTREKHYWEIGGSWDLGRAEAFSIINCGVCPIYAPEHDIFINQMGLESESVGRNMEVLGNETSEDRQQIRKTSSRVDDCYRLCSASTSSHKRPRLVSWLTPPSGTVKLNVSGRRSEGRVGYGGLLRSDTGEWLFGFSGFISLSSPTNLLRAELLAISFGLDSICWKYEYRKVICEFDSLEALKIIESADISGHDYGAIIASIRSWLTYNPNIVLQHTLREANACADFMAILGAKNGNSTPQVSYSRVEGIDEFLLADGYSLH